VELLWEPDCGADLVNIFVVGFGCRIFVSVVGWIFAVVTRGSVCLKFKLK
jgi:hypothetical protein